MLETLLKKPKAELHIHLEGSLEPEMLFALAKRNNVSIKYNSITELRNAYQFNNLQDFLDIYYQGTSVLQTEQDFFDLTYAYLTKAHQDNVTHTEMFFDPQAHLERKIQLDVCLNGINQALQLAKTNYNINGSIIPCFLRHLSEKEALITFEKLMNYREMFIGIGLDSSEVGNPPRKFKLLFETARQEKLKLVAHAGEEGQAEYVWEAIDILGVDRIDHGNSIIQDKTLMARVAKDKIGLTMCPLSNQYLKSIPDLKYHQAKEFLQHNIKVTINSDDPAYFGGYVNQNYKALAINQNLTDDEINQLIKNSFDVKFV